MQEFERDFADNLLELHHELADGSYRHGAYRRFSICDPKPRVIHKAAVRDRLVHHAVHRVLYPLFDACFIADSFSCRIGKGTHKALDRFRTLARRVSRNHSRTCWVLKCDVRKFFASISHEVLLRILAQRITDHDALRLLERIIGSFSSGTPGVGLPLGNLTSQLFANVYMNDFDQYIKRQLKVRRYIRYADDFAFLSDDRAALVSLLPRIQDFLRQALRLELHPKKVLLQSYFGMLRHGNAKRLVSLVENTQWLFEEKEY